MIHEENSQQQEDRKRIMITFLELENAEYRSKHQHRAYYAKLGRKYGLTLKEVGKAYGVTESAIRQMLAKEDA